MYLRLSVAIFLIGCCAAQIVRRQETLNYGGAQYMTQGLFTTVQRAAPCCTPKQWEGTAAEEVGFRVAHHRETDIEELDSTYGRPHPRPHPRPHHRGGAGGAQVIARLSYDYTNRRMAFSMLERGVYDRHLFHVNATLLVRNGTGYYVDRRRGTCRRFTAPEFRQFCVPSNAKLVASPVFGLGQLKTNVFAGKAGGSYGGVVYTLTMTDGACVPVGEQTAGRVRGVGFAAEHSYFDITGGIKKQSVFDVPAVCRRAVQSADVPTDMPEQLLALSAKFL